MELTAVEGEREERIKNLEVVCAGLLQNVGNWEPLQPKREQSDYEEYTACDWSGVDWGPWQCATPAAVLEQQCSAARRLQGWWRRIREEFYANSSGSGEAVNLPSHLRLSEFGK